MLKLLESLIAGPLPFAVAALVTLAILGLPWAILLWLERKGR